jgi:hypothetical protein
MGKAQRSRTAFTVRLNREDKELARWLGQYAHDHTMSKVIRLALYQFAGLRPPDSLAALLPDASHLAEQPGLTPDVIRDILRAELGRLPAPAARRDDPGGDEDNGRASPSGGLDMSRPRRSGPPKAVHAPAIAEPALSPEDSARLLVASIRGYGRSQMQNEAGG